MNLALTSQDLISLNDVQKDAVLAALFTALIADGRPGADEQRMFQQAIATLPWGRPVDALHAQTDAIGERLAHADAAGKLAFLGEVAASIPGEALREKVVLSMAAIVSADHAITAGEKGSVSAFIRTFGLTEAQIAALREKLAQG